MENNNNKTKKKTPLLKKISQHTFAHKSIKIPYNTIYSSTFQKALEDEMLKFIFSVLP